MIGLLRKKPDVNESNRARYRRYLKNEIEAVQLYSDLANVERDDDRARLFRRLAQAEMRHVRIWSRKLGLEDQSPDNYRRSLRVLVLRSIAAIFGTKGCHANDPEVGGRRR